MPENRNEDRRYQDQQKSPQPGERAKTGTTQPANPDKREQVPKQGQR